MKNYSKAVLIAVFILTPGGCLCLTISFVMDNVVLTVRVIFKKKNCNHLPGEFLESKISILIGIFESSS